MEYATGAKPVVAVAGGGYAGMAAAVTLAEAGVRCVVYEAGKNLGGRARRIEYRGEILDNGQHILAGAYAELLRLMKKVEVPDTALQRIPLRLWIPPDFLLSTPRKVKLPASLHLAFAILTATGLSVSDKFAAIRFMQALGRAKFQVDPFKSVATMLADHSQSQNLIDHLWQPLTISALNTPMESASAQVFANVLRDTLASNRMASDLLLPRVDLTALFPDPAARWVVAHGGEICAGSRIRQIVPAGRRYKVLAEIGSCEFDGVVVAVGPHQLEGLMPGLRAPALAYEPIVTVYFKFDRQVRLPEAMSGRIRGLAQWYFDRHALNAPAKASHQDNEGLIAAVISASGPHDQLSQEVLADQVFAELAQRIPDLPTPIWRKVIAERFATFACTPHADRPVAATVHPAVLLAGDYVAGDYPATLEGAVRSGVAAAQSLVAHLQASPHYRK